MAFRLFTSNKLDILLEKYLALPTRNLPADPFVPETLVVQSQGMATWLREQIALRAGNATHLEFPFVNTVVDIILAGSPGQAANPPELYSIEEVQWQVFQKLRENHPELKRLDHYLHADDDAATQEVKGYQLAGKIARVFDQYQAYRPDMVLSWEAGKRAEGRGQRAAGSESGTGAGDQGEMRTSNLQPSTSNVEASGERALYSEDLPPSEKQLDVQAFNHQNMQPFNHPVSENPETGIDWQAFLWRELTRGTPSRTARLKEFFTVADAAEDSRFECPYESLSVFGISTLPPLYLEFFIRLGQWIDVNFFYVNPCRGYWLDQLTEKEAFRLNENFDQYDLQFCELSNPLLAGLGRQGREFFSAILDSGAVNAQWEYFADFAQPESSHPPSLLQIIQQDVLDMVKRTASEREATSGADRSVQLHNCHSRMREIEVLKDNLLDIMERSGSRIQPRDILVMAPDISEYAPYIDAVFGHSRFRDLYSIADRNLLNENKAAGIFADLLNLLSSDFKASDVLALLTEETVHSAFDIAREDLDLISHWVSEAGVRWGIDRNQRRRRGKYPFVEYAWRYGLKRMLLGMAMIDETGARVGDCLPYDRIEGAQAVLLGKLIDFVENLIVFSERFSQSMSLTAWSNQLLAILDTFFRSDNDSFADIAHLRSIIIKLETYERTGGFDLPVSLGIISEYLRQAGETTMGGQRFLKGRLTFCTLQPMRSIPSPVICLIGMNDGEFPRPDKRLGFDIIAEALRPCDRSRRFEDRYLFLEALLAARRVFYISYLGQSIKDNSPLPPATPVCELLDALDDTVEVPGGIRRSLETHHCLQAFNPAYFQGSESVLKSYSMTAFAAAQQLQTGPSPRNFLANGPGAQPSVETVDLEALERFFANPCDTFVEQSLGARLHLWDSGEVKDCEPFGMDPLEAYSVNQRVVESLLAGEDYETIYERLKHDQKIEPGTPGKVKTLALCREIEENFVEAFNLKSLLAGRTSQALQVDCGNTTVSGTLELGETDQVCYRYARPKGKDVSRAWLRHLLANASGRPVTTSLVMKETKNTAVFDPMAPDRARAELHELLALYQQGLQRPLPFFSNSAYAFAISRKDGLAAAKRAFTTTPFSPGEDQDPAIRLCFPDGLSMIESADFADLAQKIFKPLFDN